MTDPFEALGLPARPDLPDEQVRAAWRAIAAATHPDRADVADLARYTAASAAAAAPASSFPRHPLAAGLEFPARVRHGRPGRLLIPAVAAAVLCLIVLHL